MGDVGVESVEGEGSTFWLELNECDAKPHHKAHQLTGLKALQSIEEKVRSGEVKVVLYIDDNPSNIKLVERILAKRHDILLLSAHEPSTGIELATLSNPGLILLDITMPEMDGYTVLKKLQALPDFQHTPVVALTANAMEKDVEKGLKAGFVAYLTKPLDVGKFFAIVDQHLR